MQLLKSLKPCYFGLCFVHMWIYCTTHRPSVSDEVSTMAVMYLVQSATLVALFLAARHSMRTGQRRFLVSPKALRVADVLGALFMSACAVALCGAVPVDGAVAAGLAAGLGGIGVTWAYARWCQFYAKLNLRLAAVLVFATMAVGSVGKAAIDLMGTYPAALCLAVVPWLCFGCAARSAANPPQTSEAPRIYYNSRTVASIARLAVGVAVFSLIFGMVQSVLLEGLPEPYHASVIVHHGSEVVIALVMVAWLAWLQRGLNFSRTWRIILVLMATALIFEPYIDASMSSFMLSLIRTAQTFLIVFLFLAIADVARHSSYSPVAVFAVGWLAYSLPFTVGKMLGDQMVADGQNFMLAMSVVVWTLVMVTLFVMDASADANRLVFAELEGADDEDSPARRAAALHDELDDMAARQARAARSKAWRQREGAAQEGRPGVAGRMQAGTPGAEAGDACPATSPAQGYGATGAAGTRDAQETATPSPAAASSSQAQPSASPQAEFIARRCQALSEQYGLTRREGEILSLLVRGRSKAHIAEAFIISENTVRGHVKHIYAKLGIHNKQELLDLFEATEC